MLELYCKKVTEEYEYEEETYQFCDYQLRWKPIADESATQPIVCFAPFRMRLFL